MAWIEVGSDFYGIDSAYFSSVADNRPLAPAILRPIARNANRMARQGGTLCNLVWDAQSVGSQFVQGAWAIFPRNDWTEIVSGLPAPHNPNCKTATLHCWAKITNGVRAYLQPTTSLRPFTPAPVVGQQLAMQGDGTLQHYTLTNVLLGPGLFESLGFYILCEQNGTTATVDDTSGSVTAVGFGYFEDSADTNTTVLGFPFFKYFVRFTDPTDNTQKLPLMRIERFSADASGTGSRFSFTFDYYNLVSKPRNRYNAQGVLIGTEPANQERVDYYNDLIMGSNFEILDPVDLQIASIALIEDTAT